MGNALIWVHRRHIRHPDVPTGWQHVRPNVAKAMIALGCAQPWNTNSRHVLPIDDGPPKGAPKPKEPKEPKPKKEPGDQEFEFPTPEEEKPKPRRKYRRRDMTAEDS